MTTLIFSISTDFKNATQIEETAFIATINEVNTASSMTIRNDTVTLTFDIVLTSNQIIDIQTIVTNYVYVSTITQVVKSVYEVVVSNDPFIPGDFTSIAAAFDAGNTSVYVRKGTYNEIKDIIVPDGGQLRGETTGKTFISFLGPYSIRLDGLVGSKQSTGTISITNNTNIIYGVGTNFSLMSIGQYILVGQTYYRITAITSDTQLTIAGTNYVTLTNVPYQAMSLITGCRVQNLFIAASGGPGIYLRNVGFSCVQSIVITNCSAGFEVIDCNACSFSRNIITTIPSFGMRINNSIALIINECIFTRCAADALETLGAFCFDIKLLHCIVKNNGLNAFNIDKNVTLSACDIEQNGNHGILIQDQDCVISNCSINNNGQDGVHVIGINNMLDSNKITDNLGNGVTSTGNSTNISACSIRGNIGTGISINASLNIINGCHVNANNDGVLILASSNHTLITSNIIHNNINQNYNDLGLNTDILGNKIINI